MSMTGSTTMLPGNDSREGFDIYTFRDVLVKEEPSTTYKSEDIRELDCTRVVRSARSSKDYDYLALGARDERLGGYEIIKKKKKKKKYI